jgi:uncharacterized protein (DUF2236 family)
MSSRCEQRVFLTESAIWKICRERAILLHGPAAAVLQVAHPRIGLGVMEHSGFADDPTARLHRTLDAVYAIAFGTIEEAEGAAKRVARRHASVRGDAAAHGVPGAEQYSADEIDLLMWVVATLVWSSIGGYERSVGTLSLAEKRKFYLEMRVLGTFFGLSEDHGPQTYDEYEQYLRRQLDDPAMGSHAISRRVAREVARPRRPWWLAMTGGPITFIFSDVLPEPVRGRLGFQSTPWTKLCMAAATIGLKLFARFAPGVVRFPPQYRIARLAVGAALVSPCAVNKKGETSLAPTGN